ncbi:MAG: mediator complex subunit [Trizodia sp. TS-e1964]|nr:MAG: mediator complex subunit [Trizodia sp. TS-e1964]
MTKSEASAQPSAEAEWSELLKYSLSLRSSADIFSASCARLHARNPLLPRSKLASMFLHKNTLLRTMIDPRILEYMRVLMDLDILQIPDLLGGMLRTARLEHAPTVLPGQEKKRYNSYISEEVLLYLVKRTLSYKTDKRRPKSVGETWGSFEAINLWMRLIVRRAIAGQHNGDESAQETPEAVGVGVALGYVVIALFNNPEVQSRIARGGPRKTLQSFTYSLSAFFHYMQNTLPQLASRLQTIHREHLAAFVPIVVPPSGGNHRFSSASGGLGPGAETILMAEIDSLGIIDSPGINSRAGPYIFLNSLFVGRPMTDDGVILSYMHSRYKGDISTLTIDLVTASFDTLSNAMFRNESAQALFLLRSFVVNKLPVLISTLSASMFPPLTPGFCITQALNHVDPQAFPSFSSFFDNLNDGGVFTFDVRQEFLFGCCLHELIPESSIEILLGEIPMQTLPAVGKYIKEQLVLQCQTDPERIEGLLGEIDGMTGNAGAVAGAITEVISNLCAAKETMSLKIICSFLARNVQALDVMLLFNSAPTILQPICHLLDTWRYEEDQGEYQPVYEEFGSILLLVLAFVHRYNLSADDIGIQDGDSFIVRLLSRGHVSKEIGDLTEEENQNLTRWTLGIFNVEAIADELMSSCTPQQFYLLVPTLISQSLTACHTKVMDLTVLRGGLEYLLETFLLPSLVSAITWISEHLWEANRDVNIVMAILETLIKPRSISGEAEIMHSTILDIIAKPVEHTLRGLQRTEPSRTDIDPLLQALKPHLSFKRPAGSYHTELESWTSASTHGIGGGGLSGSLRNTLQSLVLWSTTPDINMTPASYTHRQLLVAIQLLGAQKVLRTIIDEVKLQAQTETGVGNGELAMDIATTLICVTAASPAPQKPRSGYALREMLRLELVDVPTLYATDLLHAEILVRLHRRVETQLGLVNAGVPGLEAGLPGDGDVGDLLPHDVHDVDMTDLAATGVADLDDVSDLDDVFGSVGLLADVPMEL